ncbi:hypothetical protein EBZ39_03575 [bacterium]|nr:hypothetical protein [bacterium]
MIVYIVVFPKTLGYLVMGYGVGGILEKAENCFFEIEDEQREHFARFVWDYQRMDNLIAYSRAGYCTLVKQEEDLTFERFWAEFDMQKDRIDADKLWQKMKDSEKRRVFHNIQAYNRYCVKNKGWYKKMYPKSYLGGKKYLDEWDKI